MNTKKPTRAQRIAKVKRALKKFVAWNGEKPLTVQKAVLVGNFNDDVMLYLGNGVFTLLKQTGLSGVVGGYNRYALNAVAGLHSVRVLSGADVSAFDYWWRERERENMGQSEMAHLRELAQKHGYRLQKNPKRAA